MPSGNLPCTEMDNSRLDGPSADADTVSVMKASCMHRCTTSGKSEKKRLSAISADCVLSQLLELCIYLQAYMALRFFQHKSMHVSAEC